MSVSDLTGTTWLINGTFTEPASTIYAYINFVSNSENFGEIRIYDGREPGTGQTIFYITQERDTVFACEQGWTNEAYRTIAITGGEDATNSSLITWLENNATQVVQTGDVIVSYAGADVATMSDSGTKTLKTQGKYCTDDIIIEYTKSSGGGGGTSLETASVTIDMSALVGGGFGFLITGTQLDGGGLTYSVNQVDDSQETITFDAVVGTNVTIESFGESGWHWYSDEGKIENTDSTTESCQVVCVRGADTIHIEV